MKIREVSQLLGVKAYVLRYWESEFPMLRPQRTPGGQRVYSPEDIALLRRMIELLHVQKYSIVGARKVLADQRSMTEHQDVTPPDPVEQRDRARRELLYRVRAKLIELVELLDQKPEQLQDE